MSGIKLSEKRTVIRALDIYAASPKLDFEDAMAIATMEPDSLNVIVSYDRDFDGVAGIVREEPAIV
jgi:predicted nucleic acid-binding protein